MARRAGVALSAVKYYQREGLIPAGERSAPNQVDYGEPHVQRVRLIRALLETGGLSIAATRSVVAVLDAQDAPIAEAFAVAQHALAVGRGGEAGPSESARDRIARLAAAKGWRVGDANPGLDAAARTLDGFGAIGFDAPDAYLDAYADAAATAARADLDALGTRADPDGVAELMVVGTVLGDPLFAGLRRLAQEHATHDAFPVTPSPHPERTTP